MKQTLSVVDYRLLMISLGLLLLALFLNLSLVPLSLEEPRRALIGLEMLFNGNLLVPTEMGEYYYKKPPMFNWLLLASFKLFGEYSELAARTVTVISLMLWGLLNFYFLKQYTSLKVALYSSLLLVVSADIFFSFSLLAEIDIFYSFITYASIIVIYHFYQRGNLLLLFISCYMLSAIGVLTKGLPSFIFPAISLGIFFITQGEWKKLITWQHLAGIGSFLLIIGSYFYAYSFYNDPSQFVNFLWSQSSDRTLLKNSFGRFIAHLFSFPFIVLKDLLPASILVIFIFKRDVLQRIWKNDLMRFCLLMFASNILIYWISPGTRSRYVYMLYPFPITILTFLFYEYVNTSLLASKILYYLRYVIIALLVATCMILPWMDVMTLNEHVITYAMVSGTLLAFVTYFIQSNKPSNIPTIITLVIVARIMFDLFVLPVRAVQGEQPAYKKDAEKILALTEGEQVNLYGELYDGKYSLGIVFYIERDKHAVLGTEVKNCQDYFIAHTYEVENDKIEVFYEFSWKNMHNYYLFKFTDCP